MTSRIPSELLHLFIIGLLCLAAYANTLHSPFVLDDREVIVGNPITHDLRYFLKPWTARQFTGHFEYKSFKMRYVAFLTFACNYALHKLDLPGYHAFNILGHTLTAWAVYFLLIMLLKTPALGNSALARSAPAFSLIVAAIFAVHPIQTAAVTYIWQRTAMLCALFYVGAIVCYGFARLSCHGANVFTTWKINRRATVFYLASLFFCLLASRTKENSVTLPVSILALEFVLFEGGCKKRMLYVMPFFLVMANIGLSLGNGSSLEPVQQSLASNAVTKEPYSRIEYLYTQFRVVVTYLRLIIFPVGQRLIYDMPSYKTIWNTVVGPSLFLHLVLIGGALHMLGNSLRKQAAAAWTLVAVGVCWFYLTLAIESSVLVLSDLVFEHRMYLPSVGVIIAIVAMVTILGERAAGRKATPLALIAVAIPVIIGLLFTTIERNNVWGSEESLWQDNIVKSPSSIMVHYEMGMLLAKKQKYMEAIPFFKKASTLEKEIKGKGWNSPALNNLGNCYFMLGRLLEAKQAWNEAYQENRDNFLALYNIGMTEDKLGNFRLAIQYYTEFIKYSSSPPPPEVLARIKQLEGLLGELKNSH